MEQPFSSPEPTADRPAAPPVTHLNPVSEDAGEASLLGAAVLAAFGAAALVVDAVGRAVQASRGRPDGDGERGTPSGPATAIGAAAALTLATGRSAAKVAAAVGRGAAFTANMAVEAGPPFLRRFRDDVGRRAADLDDRWREERVDAEEGARRIAEALLPQTVSAVLDTLDLTAIVVERVDLDRVVDEVDLAAIVERIDLQGVIDRVDIGSIVDRVDVQAIVDRLDLDAIVARIDVVGIAGEVIDELDLGSLIRQSTEAVTTESIEGVRLHSASADRYVQHLVDQVLRRRRSGAPRVFDPDAAGGDTQDGEDDGATG